MEAEKSTRFTKKKPEVSEYLVVGDYIDVYINQYKN